MDSTLHLPDLPQDGYGTRREKQLSDAIMLFLRGIERNRLMLLNIVIEGPDKWRKIVQKEWRGFRVNPELSAEMFRYLQLLAVRPYIAVQLLRAKPDQWQLLMKEAMPDVEAQREKIRLLEKWNPYN